MPEHDGDAGRGRGRDNPEVEVHVGRVGAAHGVRGDVTVEVRTDEPDRRFAVGTRFDTERGTLTVLASRPHGRRLAVRFAGVDDRDAARALRGTELTARLDPDESPAADDEFYDHQLVGLRVEVDGATVGTVADVVHLPGQDLLAVSTPAGERLVPFVAALVPEVDPARGRVRVSDAPGLLRDV